MSWLHTVALLAMACTASMAWSADLNGTWRLNVEKSHWGTRPKPLSVTLTISHNEPALSYSGVVHYAGEDARSFEFSGAVDGKPYPMVRSFGTGTATLRRLNANTFQTVFRTFDGTVETTETILSPNGQSLVRRIHLRSAGITSSSTEVYERTQAHS